MFERIKKWLNSKSISFKEINHSETKTSEESAIARGEKLDIGGKALVVKVNDEFGIFVLSAAKRLNSLAIKKYFKTKKMRFASTEELYKLTELKPGSVPPFGKPIIELKLYVDNSILDNTKIAFNAGSLTDSIIMDTNDYIKLSNPVIFDFSM